MTGSPRPSRPVWGPVLVAAVLLAVIGASAGWVIGTRSEAAERDAAREASRGATEQPTDVPSSAQPESTDDGPTDDGPTDDGPTDDGPTDDGGDGGEGLGPDRCPPHTARLAASRGADGTLRRVLYIRTDDAQVWICADDGGRLFYQGHQYPKGEDLVEGDNALFLTDVVADGDRYVATNTSGRGTTIYRVSRERLVQGDGGDDDESWPVRLAAP